MAITITAADVLAVKVIDQITAPTDEVIVRGQMVRYSTTTGKLTKAKGTAAAEARVLGMAITDGSPAGMTITAVKRGWVEVGTALGDCDFDQELYLDNTDGAIGTAAGTVSTVIGRVAAGWGYTTADKVLSIEL